MEGEVQIRVAEVNRYESTMNSQIMQLNNDIGNKKMEQDQI